MVAGSAGADLPDQLYAAAAQNAQTAACGTLDSNCAKSGVPPVVLLMFITAALGFFGLCLCACDCCAHLVPGRRWRKTSRRRVAPASADAAAAADAPTAEKPAGAIEGAVEGAEAVIEEERASLRHLMARAINGNGDAIVGEERASLRYFIETLRLSASGRCAAPPTDTPAPAGEKSPRADPTETLAEDPLPNSIPPWEAPVQFYVSSTTGPELESALLTGEGQAAPGPPSPLEAQASLTLETRPGSRPGSRQGQGPPKARPPRTNPLSGLVVTTTPVEAVATAAELAELFTEEVDGGDEPTDLDRLHFEEEAARLSHLPRFLQLVQGVARSCSPSPTGISLARRSGSTAVLGFERAQNSEADTSHSPLCPPRASAVERTESEPPKAQVL